MKNKLIKILVLIMACLMLFSAVTGCKKTDEEGESTTTAATTSGEEPTPEPASRLLSSFSLVRSLNSSDDVKNLVVELNKTIKELVGSSGGLKIDEASQEGNEIVIGNTMRAASDVLDELAYDEYVYKTSIDENGYVNLVVGGNNDNATIKAINEFKAYLKTLVVEGGDQTEVPDMDTKADVKDLVISDDVAKSMVIIYSKTADTKIQKIANILRNDMLKALGVRPTLVTVPEGGDISQYKNAIILGGVGTEATALKANLKTVNSYTAKVESTDEGTRVYLVVYTTLSTIRAAQYFYSKAVINGDFRIPKYLDANVTTLTQRDPGILLHDGVYYIYASYNGGYGVRTSTDLLNWSAMKQVWQKAIDEPNLEADTQYWAPEGYYHNGKFYIFTTCGVSSYGNTGTSQRGCIILRCDTPDGRFKLISKASADATNVGWITPNTMSAIDGHLWVDEAGKPWLVFVREWTHTSDGYGRMSYAPLSEDLTHLTGEWRDMFKSNDPSWTTYKVTDGPWMYKASNGDLFMIWSNMATSSRGYAVGLAKSSNGKIDGTWTQLDPLYIMDGDNIYNQTNGGHGCIFTGLDGRLYLAIHSINDPDAWTASDAEYPDANNITAITVIPIVEADGTLKLDLVK